MGWASNLSITRFRLVGDLDYSTDEFVSPWGRLVSGGDGYWYVAGEPGVVRLEPLSAGEWKAIVADGTSFVFAERIETTRGTYRWMLTRANTPAGEVTEVSYDRNASGRPFASLIEYGGRGAPRQVQVEIEYELLSAPFEDYRSGERLDLDRRVKRVHVRTRAGGTGDFALRWTYELSHTVSPLSQVFYLAGVDKRFASGEMEPRVTYEYDLPQVAIDAAKLVHVDALDAYLTAAGDVALQPDKVAFLDVEADGLTDLEHHYTQTQIRRVGDGYVMQELPPSATADPACKPPPSDSNPPRLLARMTAGAAEPQVVHASASGGSTTVRVCDLSGQLLDAQSLAGTWPLQTDPAVRVVDLNQDGRPDLLRVWPGGYQVLPNESAEDGYAFGAAVTGTLSTVVTPDTVWIEEMNGDGMVDLVVRYGAGLAVFPGKGNFAFEPEARAHLYRTLGGTFITNPQTYEHTFADVNRDGLMDVLLSRGAVLHLFANDGAGFQEVEVPAFSTLSWNTLYPVAADLSGRGETEVVFVQDGQAHALALTRPGTGLLRAADDGKGTVVRFEYRRAAPEKGVFHRQSVLTRLEVASSADGLVSYEYDHSGAVVHSRGKHLIGYKVARRAGPLATEEVTFHHDDNLSAVVLSAVTKDARSLAYRFDETQYEERLHAGQRWWRPTHQKSGWRSLDGTEEATEEIHFDKYDREVCPTRTRRLTTHGELLTDVLLADPPGLAGAPHCLSMQERVTGMHADSSLDFVYTVRFARNAMGDVTQVSAIGDSGPLVLQDIAYDSDHRVASVSSPGQGATVVSYDSATGLVASVTDPLGVTSSAVFDPVHDVLEELRIDRGALWTGEFRFDGQERLVRSWDNLAGGSTLPIQEIDYAFATHDAPASVRTRTAKSPVATFDVVDYLTASGQEVASAVRIPDGWALETVTTWEPSLG